MPNRKRNPSGAKAEVSRPLTLPPAGVDVSKLSDRELLEMAIAATPDPRKPGRSIPAVRFADDVAKCNGRTLRRYLAKEGARPLPELLREKCEALVRTAARKASRAAVVDGIEPVDVRDIRPADAAATVDPEPVPTEPSPDFVSGATHVTPLRHEAGGYDDAMLRNGGEPD
jgi:hypothetical protein